MIEQVTHGKLQATVRRSSARRTIEVAVERDGSVAIRAPERAPLSVLETALAKKEEWVFRHLKRKAILLRAWAEPQYLPGRSFSYLGRNYRLRLVDSSGRQRLRLLGGWFELERDELERAPGHFSALYAKRGREWLPTRVERLASRLGVEPGKIVVRDLKFRWASCGLRAMSFHWRVMALPPHIIDYVAVHELAHRVERRHSKRFWLLVEQVMPDWRDRQEWLAKNGPANPR